MVVPALFPRLTAEVQNANHLRPDIRNQWIINGSSMVLGILGYHMLA